MLQSKGLQRVGHNRVTEQQIYKNAESLSCLIYKNTESLFSTSETNNIVNQLYFNFLKSEKKSLVVMGINKYFVVMIISQYIKLSCCMAKMNPGQYVSESESVSHSVVSHSLWTVAIRLLCS